MSELLSNLEQLPNTDSYRLEFEVLETLRKLGGLATQEGINQGEFIDMFSILSQCVNSFTIKDRSEVIAVTPIVPNPDKLLVIGVEKTDEHNRKYTHRVSPLSWFAPDSEYEQKIERRANLSPIFYGDRYTLGVDPGLGWFDELNFVVHNDFARVLITPDLKVSLVDRSGDEGPLGTSHDYYPHGTRRDEW
jgi:hypothetical protein